MPKRKPPCKFVKSCKKGKGHKCKKVSIGTRLMSCRTSKKRGRKRGEK